MKETNKTQTKSVTKNKTSTQIHKVQTTSDTKKNLGKRLDLSTFLFALLAGITAVVYYSNMMGDYDLLWHTKLGEYITLNLDFPTTDIFSWIGIEKELPFTAHSWFFSIFCYNASKFCVAVEQVGNIVVFLGAFTLFFIVKLCLFPKRSCFLIIVSFLIGIICSNPRPQVFGYGLFFLSLYLMTRHAEKEKSKAIFFIPILASMWASIHGGTIPILFCFEFLFLILWTLPNFKIGPFVNENKGGYDGALLLKKNTKSKDELWNNWKIYVDSTLKRPWLKGIALILTSLIGALYNPYLTKIFTYGFVENNDITKKYISEWQPIKLLDTSAIFVMAIITIYFFIFYKEGIKLSRFLPTICCFFVSGVYGRFAIYAVIASFFLIADIVNKFTKKGWTNIGWNVSVIVFFLLFSSILTSSYTSVVGNKTMDKETVAYLKEQSFERPFTCHNDGGRLIYEGLPTFIDPRFTDALMEDAILAESMMLKDKTIEEYTNEYNFDAFLFNKEANSPLEDYLRIWDEWEVGFENDYYVVFIPSSTK